MKAEGRLFEKSALVMRLTCGRHKKIIKLSLVMFCFRCGKAQPSPECPPGAALV